MIRTKLYFIIIMMLAAISCDKKEDNKVPYPLTFEKESYELSLNLTSSIMIRSGNRDYTLIVEDSSILKAEIDLNTPLGMGDIRITGKKKGETILSVTDNFVKETVKLTIKITEAYFPFFITKSNHPALKERVIMSLSNDDNHTAIFISANNPSTIISKGLYEFSVEQIEGKNIPYITLFYASDENGHFFDTTGKNVDIVPTAHKFDISGNSNQMYKVLSHFFNVNWEGMIQTEDKTRETGPKILKMMMKEVCTEYEILCSFTASASHIPNTLP